MLSDSKNKKVHLIGIGGIGVSALARWFLHRGWRVSGSDLSANKITRELQREGVRIFVGHQKTNIPKDTDLVVWSQAISPQNPELVETRRNKIPQLSYPEALGILSERHTTIAIAGAHGKSTTTALVGLILKNARFDPTIIVGTGLKEFGGKNFRAGKSKYLVLEADEWKAAFWNYSPTLAIITNIDEEHIDFYKNLKNIKTAFLKFIARVRPGGTLVLNKDNKILASLDSRISKLCQKNKVRIVWYSIRNPISHKIRRIIQIPGDHNVSNAIAAYTATKLLGASPNRILRTIAAYKGAWRRFEHRGEFKVKSYKLNVSVPVYDDYAHHPTEITATLKAFKERFPERNVICVFQPHQAKRLQALFLKFIQAFDPADTIVITPFYKVAGRDEKISPRFDSKSLVRQMQNREPNKPIFYLSDFKHLKEALKTLIEASAKPAVVVMMGAGNIVEYTGSLLDRKKKKE